MLPSPKGKLPSPKGHSAAWKTRRSFIATCYLDVTSSYCSEQNRLRDCVHFVGDWPSRHDGAMVFFHQAQ